MSDTSTSRRFGGPAAPARRKAPPVIPLLALLALLGAASPQARAQISVIANTYAPACAGNQALNTFGALALECGAAVPATNASIALSYTGQGTASATGYAAALATMDYTVRVLGPNGSAPTTDVPLIFSAAGQVGGLRSKASLYMTYDDGFVISSPAAECIVGGCFVRGWSLQNIGFTLAPGEYAVVNMQLGVAGFGTNPSNGQFAIGAATAQLSPLVFSFQPGFDSSGYSIVLSEGVGVAPVPEPATGGLLLAGYAVVGLVARRRVSRR